MAKTSKTIMPRIPLAGLALDRIAVFVVALGSIVLPAHTQSVAPTWPTDALIVASLIHIPEHADAWPAGVAGTTLVAHRLPDHESRE
jgi:integral membrane sensor domain MASE1